VLSQRALSLLEELWRWHHPKEFFFCRFRVLRG
jgi:hypothetical protein